MNHPWQGQKIPADFYTVKGILEALFDKLQLLPNIRYEKTEREGMHPGQTANVLLNDQRIGFIGKIHPDMEKQYDIKNVFVFELMLEHLLNAETAPLAYQAIPRFPNISGI